MHGSQWAQDASSPENFEAFLIGQGCHRNHTEDYNSEIHTVPCVSEIGAFVDDKAHRNDFKHALCQEDVRKHLVTDVKNLIPPRVVVCVVVFVVLF